MLDLTLFINSSYSLQICNGDRYIRLLSVCIFCSSYLTRRQEIRLLLARIMCDISYLLLVARADDTKSGNAYKNLPFKKCLQVSSSTAFSYDILVQVSRASSCAISSVNTDNQSDFSLAGIVLAAQTIPPFLAHFSVAWSVRRLSVCRSSHSCILLKAFDVFRRHLAGTLLGSNNTWC